MKLEAGKYYRTRGGQKVGPMNVPPKGGRWSNAVIADYEYRGWLSGGRYFDDNINRDEDIIAEWSEPTHEALTAELAALDARKAEVQAQLDAMPKVYRQYWGIDYPGSFSRKSPKDTHYLEWAVENGIPRVIGDFKRIDE